jgi:hypothetical protein
MLDSEMHEMFTDPFASHVYQAFLYTLSGHPMENLVDERTGKKRKTDTKSKVQIPPTFTELQTKLFTIVKQWDLSLLQNLAFDKYAVPLLQKIIENDLPKKVKRKSKGNAGGEQTIADIFLFGRNVNPDSEGNSRRLLR